LNGNTPRTITKSHRKSMAKSKPKNENAADAPAHRVQWLKLAERERLYKKTVPDFQKMILTDHRGARISERVNVAQIVSDASGVNVSTVRRDIRVLRQRALKGKAPAEVELYPYLMHVKKMNALAEKFTEPETFINSAELEVELAIVSELEATLKALIGKLNYFGSDPSPLEALHESLAEAVQTCRAEIKKRSEAPEDIPF